MNTQYETPRFIKFLFSNDVVMPWVWLVVRIYVGWEWVTAGWQKFTSPAWVGTDAGTAIAGFVQGAVSKTAGAHPDVSGWYAYFLQHIVLPHSVVWSYLITYGEILVGVALIIGLLTGLAAFFGLFMNLNFMLAGSLSANPVLFTLSILLSIAWKISGYIGVDRFCIPALQKKKIATESI